MKYRQVLIVASLILLFPLFLFAQNPLFQTTIRFEDAIGNTDSIIIGFDTTANGEFNPSWGEVNITKPFDSVFDVRGVHQYHFASGIYSSSPIEYMSKKIIGFAEKIHGVPFDCYAAEGTIILVNIKHQPLTIMWDSDLFSQSDCSIKGSYLTPDITSDLGDPIHLIDKPGARYKCAALTDSFTVYLGSEYLNFNEDAYMHLHSIEGKGVDTIFGVAFKLSFWGGSNPCNQAVNTDNITAKKEMEVILSPNPVRSVLSIKSSLKILNKTIYNMDGNMISMKALDEENIDVAGLNAGVYFIKLELENEASLVKKFIKVE